MTQSEINERLIQVAAGKRTHPHYGRTVSLAKRYRAVSTGDGIEAYMKTYSRREDKGLFKARCEITSQITPSIISNLFAGTEKAFRSHYRRELGYGEGEGADVKTAEFEAMLAKYAGGMGVDGFLKERMLELNATDPNAWIVQEWKDFDNYKQYADVYPFEASAEMAVDFFFERGDLQYLTVLTMLPNPADESKPLKKYTCYQKQFSSTLRQTGETNGVGTENTALLTDKAEVNIEGEVWAYDEFYHGLGQVKAFRAGYKRDKVTNGQTFVWPIEAAEPYLMKSLKVVSELDLTAANVAMPISIRYGDVCNAPGCDGGYVGHSYCTACEGTGRKKSPTSVLEEIVVTPMPSSADGMLDLSKMLVYVSPDVAILQWQQGYVKELAADCRKAYFNSEVFDGKEIQETATGKSLDKENANDVVYKFFRFYADVWQFTVYAVADITAKRGGLTAQIVVSRDLKLKTLAELMEDLTAANESGAGPAARQAIEWDMMRVIYADNPQEFAEWQVKERFNPFSGFTQEEKMVWAQSPLIPMEQRVLYANLGYIFDQLTTEKPDFYKMAYSEQKVLVSAKVKELMGTVEATAQPPAI